MRDFMWELNTADAIAYEKELAEMNEELQLEITEDILRLKEYIKEIDERLAEEIRNGEMPF